MTKLKFIMKKAIARPQDSQSWPKWDVALMGRVIDDRGKAARDFISSLAKEVIEFSYDPTLMVFTFLNHEYDISKIHEIFRSLHQKSCVIESTTLSVPEIMLISKNMVVSKRVRSFDYIYFEPKYYYRPKKTELLSRRDFELTKEFMGFKGIPGFTCPLDGPIEDTVIFLVGYEGDRLANAIESLYIEGKNCHVVFGVPAFCPGWEADSFANNIRVICTEHLNYGISFCAADNPLSVYELLEEMYYATKNNNKDFFVAPLGTKPHSIGVSLFCSVYQEAGILYDHPLRQEGRSSEFGACHLYKIEKVRK